MITDRRFEAGGHVFRLAVEEAAVGGTFRNDATPFVATLTSLIGETHT